LTTTNIHAKSRKVVVFVAIAITDCQMQL